MFSNGLYQVSFGMKQKYKPSANTFESRKTMIVELLNCFVSTNNGVIKYVALFTYKNSHTPWRMMSHGFSHWSHIHCIWGQWGWKKEQIIIIVKTNLILWKPNVLTRRSITISLMDKLKDMKSTFNAGSVLFEKTTWNYHWWP